MAKKFSPPAPPFISARWHGGKQTPRTIVIHGTVSPCTPGGARSVAKFFANHTQPTSAHYTVDPSEAIQSVGDHTVAYHCGYNQDSIGVELCDPQAGKDSRWQDANHAAMLKRAAALVAQLCLAYDIPIKRISVADLKAGRHGICGHADMSIAFRRSTHTDPGAAFPWKQFLALVRSAAADLTAPAKPAPKPAAKPVKKATRTLRIGTYNVERDRNTQAVLGELTRLTRNLDVLMLQETNGYGDTLTKVPGFRPIRYTAAKEQGETAILVRDGLEVHYARAEQVTTTGWRTVRGSRTSPKWGTFARVEGCGFLSVHTAPTVQSAVKRLASPARWKSYRELMASIRRLAPKMPKPLVVGADWNVDARTDGGKLADFPRSTLAHVGMLRAFPTTGTHGSRVIDGFGIKGAVVSDVRALSGYDSDHRPVVATITY